MDKYIYIFLHLPKTGGTTFSQHLVSNLNTDEILSTSQLRYNLIDSKIKKDKIKVILGHASYYGIHKQFPNKIPRYIVFLRDPAERIVSSYNFEMRARKGVNIPFWVWYKSQLKNEMVYFLDLKFRGKEGTKANLPKSSIDIFSKIARSKRNYYFFQRFYEKYISIFQSSERIQRRRLENGEKVLNKCWYIGIIPGLDKDLKHIFKEIGIREKWKNENITTKSEKFFPLDKESRQKMYEDNNFDKELFDYALGLKKGY